LLVLVVDKYAYIIRSILGGKMLCVFAPASQLAHVYSTISRFYW
ncbi:MAG: hypothetical protein ACJAX5_001844, partial [Patiriisocius sp.]